MSHIKSGIIGKMSLPSDQAGISLHTGNWTSDLGLVARPLSLSSSLTCCVQLGIKHTESLFYTLILCVPSSVCSARFSVMCLCSSRASVVSDSFCIFMGSIPTNLLYLWDSPVKNIEMVCYLLLQRIFLPHRLIWVSCLLGRFFTIWASKEASDSPPHK